MESKSLPSMMEQRLAELRALCPMHCRELDFGSSSLLLWTARDTEPLLQALSAKPADHPDVLDERIPYWASLWPSSLLMAQHIFDTETLPRGPWIELGCGPGLAGLAACARGVPGTVTDYMPEALRLAELNALQNHGCAFGTRLLDWRNPPDDLQAPWIIAADVAYETRLFDPLLRSFEALLAPGGEIWFGEPGRPIARPFFTLLAESGWVSTLMREADGRHLHRLRRTRA